LSKYAVQPTGVERRFGDEEIIVSKTDTTGHLLYVNDVFCRIGLYKESELLGKPHSIIRHPDMPRCVFKLMWETLQAGEEIFAYVKNLAKNGDHYWVLAHVTPSYGADGRIVGFHSNRRVPDRSAVAVIEPLYRSLAAIEERHPDRKAGMNDAYAELKAHLARQSLAYDEFVFSLVDQAA